MLPLADFAVIGRDPWSEFGRLGLGLLAPDPGAIEQAAQAVALTLAFAVAGVAPGAGAGLLLAPFYGRLPARLFSMVPPLFAPALALCLYRWEIIVRESAIVGVLGTSTIGFHIDSAIVVEALRMTRSAPLSR